MILKRMIKLLKEYLKMNNLELTDINKYRLNGINKLKDFNNEISERKDIIKKLNKYIVSFDYLDKIFKKICRCFVDFNIYVNKSLLRVTKKRKKKHNKIIALAKSKLSIIDTLLSSALNDSKISQEEFTNVITENKHL